MAATLAVCWIVGNIAGLGLPDRAVFDGAARVGQPNSTVVPDIGCGDSGALPQAHWVSQQADARLVTFAQGLILGAGAQGLSAVGLSWLRVLRGRR